jgi:exopolysaccharide biosynthesis polyprenyl glycosylphosphotransferase
VTRRDRPRWWRDVLLRRMLALADVVAAVLAGAIAAGGVDGSLWALVLAPVWVLLAKLLGLYDRDHRAVRHLTFDELPAIAAWALGVVAVLLLFLPLTDVGAPERAAAAEALVAAGLAAAIARGGARWLWRRLTPPEVTLIVGEGEPAEAIRRRARLFGDMHLQLADRGPVPLSELGDPEGELEKLGGSVDRIIVASSEVKPDLIGGLAVACRAHQVKLSVVSTLRGRALPALRLSQVADLPLLEFNTWDPSRSTIALKRAFDVLFSLAALIVLAPLLLLITVAVRLDSRGPAIFTQYRAGLRERPFRMLKFRTMHRDAEERLPDLIDLDKLEEPVFKLDSDPRVTRVGRVLRRFSLDELPQLANVVLGQMSLVGPRPEQIELVERYRPEHRFRLQVKPGMTGPMQVYGRAKLTFAERLAVELEYVENLSFGRDLKILALTFPSVLRGTGAY